jgi:glutathione S-transferase
LSGSKSALTIYSVAACPYAQRTRILLHLKGLQADLVELDLSKPRPSWFLDINPAGKVPALVHGGRALNESSVINEYLEDVFPDRAVFPSDPYLKAQSRNLIEFCNAQFTTNLYRVLMEQDSVRRARAEAAARKDWEWLEAFLMRVSPDADFAFAEFGMADLTYAPFFQRYELNEYFWGFRIPDGLKRVARWRRALADHPSVGVTSLPMEDYAKLYADYSLGFSNGAIPPGHERSALDPTVPLSERPMPPRRVA